jgi:hypothetical protein
MIIKRWSSFSAILADCGKIVGRASLWIRCGAFSADAGMVQNNESQYGMVGLAPIAAFGSLQPIQMGGAIGFGLGGAGAIWSNWGR